MCSKNVPYEIISFSLGIIFGRYEKGSVMRAEAIDLEKSFHQLETLNSKTNHKGPNQHGES